MLREIANKVKRPPFPKPKIQDVWAECVSEARGLLTQVHKLRFRIADLAIQACHIGDGRHTPLFEHEEIKRFAGEIGMVYQTLWDWVTVKQRVVDKLPADEFDPDNYDYSVLLDVRRRITTTGESVGDAYKDEKARAEKPVIKKFDATHSRLQNIRGFLTKENVSGQDPTKLRDIARWLNDMLSVVNGELDGRDKPQTL